MLDLVASARVDRKILEIIDPLARSMGFEIIRLRLHGGQTKSLQIMAERMGGGMDVSDCATLSRAISVELDVSDPISSKYTLEVSSPGIDRPLTRPEHFSEWVGHETRIETSAPLEGRSRYRGKLLDASEDMVRLAVDDEIVTIDMLTISKAKLVMSDALLAAAVRNRNENGIDRNPEIQGGSE